MDLLRIARVPPITIETSSTVREAVSLMTELRAGAVVTVAGERSVGIFTASDLLRRVFAHGRPLDRTPVSEVMTSPLKMVRPSATREDALRIMVTNHIRHLPIVDGRCKVLGMLSTRHLLRNMVENLSQELASLDAYICADGIGG
jgi:CBS domain-containing protein